MKNLDIAFVQHSWVLTVTYNDDTTGTYTWGGDVSLQSAVEETKRQVALKEKAAVVTSHRLVNGSPTAIAALEKRIRSEG